MTSREAQRFGPYVLLDRIGDGGMAEIFLAKTQGYSGFEKLIALKRILPRYGQNQALAQLLIQEAKLAASLQHFNVAQVLDLGEIDGQVFIAMEYVRGRDLAAILSSNYRRKERLSVGLSLYIATEFITGLDYAHRHQAADGTPLGIIHRDISPQNILVSYEGEVKVTDFGIARVLLGKEGIRLPGELQGKFGYMSPELLMNDPVDQRSDIFSTGVVLWELLTGQRLFRAKGASEALQMIAKHDVSAPSTINPEVPPGVDRICAKALARDRELRYQTMGAFLGELSHVSDYLAKRNGSRDLAVFMRRQYGASSRDFVPRPKTRESSPIVGAVDDLRPRRLPLGELLLTQGVLSPQDLELALAEQRARGGRLGAILIAAGSVSEDDLSRALSTQSGLPLISDDDLLALEPPPRLATRFPREAAEATMTLPLSPIGRDQKVRLVVADPYDHRAMLEAKVVLGVGDIVPFLAKRSSIRAAIERWYRGSEPDPAAQAHGREPPPPTERPDSLPPRSLSNAGSAHPTELGPVLVLIVDAEPDAVAPLAEQFKDEDWDVELASDAETAMAKFRVRRPTVTLLDTHLPDTDALGLLYELRDIDADAVIIMASREVTDDLESDALELGADGVFSKPFSVSLTTSKIRRELQVRARARRSGAPAAAPFDGVSGSLKDMPLHEIVQSLELGRKTAHVVLQYDDGRSGEINVQSGEVVGCVSPMQTAEVAFYALAPFGTGQFRIEYRRSPIPANITASNTALMLEALRRLDEASPAGTSASGGSPWGDAIDDWRGAIDSWDPADPPPDVDKSSNSI